MSAPPVPFDWVRLLIGDQPPLFYLEIVFRTVFTFGVLLIMLRFTGKRSLAQLSVIEFAIVIALGSAAGDPMFYADVPLLQAALVIVLVVGLQRGLAWLVRRSEPVETFVEGRPSELARDGRIRLTELEQARLSFEDLFESLRNQGVRQLGEVQRAYLEQNGQLSVFTHQQGRAPPGLPIVPPWDVQPPPTLPPGSLQSGPLACLGCGEVTAGGRVPTICPHCGQQRGWTLAVTDPLAQETARS